MFGINGAKHMFFTEDGYLDFKYNSPGYQPTAFIPVDSTEYNRKLIEFRAFTKLPYDWEILEQMRALGIDV